MNVTHINLALDSKDSKFSLEISRKIGKPRRLRDYVNVNFYRSGYAVPIKSLPLYLNLCVTILNCVPPSETGHAPSGLV